MEETGWLIEKWSEELHRPVWLRAYYGVFGWTYDSLEAIRFSRKSDAEQIKTMLHNSEKLETTEHGWFGN